MIVVDEPLGRGAGPSWAPLGAPLASVTNRPLIAHAVETLKDAGVEGIVVVADHQSAALLRRSLAEVPSSLGSIEWVEVDEAVGEGAGILAARALLDGERFLLHRADGMLLRGGSALRLALQEPGVDATVFFRERRIGEPTPLRRARHGATALLTEAPSAERLELGGVHAFGPAMLGALSDVEPGPGGERDLLAAIDRLSAEDGSVRAGIVESWWRYAGHADDLLAVNQAALDLLDGDPEGLDLPDCRMEGRVRIHPTAEVTGTTIRGPVLIGARARVCDAYLGPYTSVGADVEVENSEVESSILLAGSSLRNVGTRVEGSILGRDAVVRRDFRLPRGLRLLLGEGAHVTLS